MCQNMLTNISGSSSWGWSSIIIIIFGCLVHAIPLICKIFVQQFCIPNNILLCNPHKSCLCVVGVLFWLTFLLHPQRGNSQFTICLSSQIIIQSSKMSSYLLYLQWKVFVSCLAEETRGRNWLMHSFMRYNTYLHLLCLSHLFHQIVINNTLASSHWSTKLSMLDCSLCQMAVLLQPFLSASYDYATLQICCSRFTCCQA